MYYINTNFIGNGAIYYMLSTLLYYLYSSLLYTRNSYLCALSFSFLLPSLSLSFSYSPLPSSLSLSVSYFFLIPLTNHLIFMQNLGLVCLQSITLILEDDFNKQVTLSRGGQILTSPNQGFNLNGKKQC